MTQPQPTETEPSPKSDKAPSDKDRVAKYIARAGLGSRREVEAWILEGRVSVNGTILTSPALNVSSKDLIVVDGKPLPQRERTRLWLYHKPRGYITTQHDPEGRPTVFSILPENLPRVVSVGRLDINTEGLLLLTNDGALAGLLENPRTGWTRRYRVRAFGKITQDAIDQMAAGMTVDGIHYGPIETHIDRDMGENVWLTMALTEGKNREIKNVLKACGLEVGRLIRTSYGPFQLKDLPEGTVEEVPLRILKDQISPKMAADAGLDFESPIQAIEPTFKPKPHRSERHARAAEHAGKPLKATRKAAQFASAQAGESTANIDPETGKIRLKSHKPQVLKYRGARPPQPKRERDEADVQPREFTPKKKAYNPFNTPARSAKPYAERGERSERPTRDFKPRDSKPRDDKPRSAPRSTGGDAWAPRDSRAPRPERTERFDRSERPARMERFDRSDRPARPDQPRADRLAGKSFGFKNKSAPGRSFSSRPPSNRPPSGGNRGKGR